MLSMKVIGSSGKAKSYYAEYAQEKGEVSGHFYDRSGELGIDGKEVTADQLMHLLQGYTPDGKDELARNAGEHHRGGWDLTFSAPKSVSIVWANASPELRASIEAAQDKATREALDYLSAEATMTRTGHGGAVRERAAMVAATFQHSSNRAEEPQLHTHALVFNIGRSDHDGRWRTLEGRDLFVAKMAGGAVYKAELAHELQRLGFEIERTKASFEISGVSREVMQAQSSRSRDVEQWLLEHGLTRDTAPASTKEYAALTGRSGKSERMTRDFGRWQEENSQYGFGPKEQAGLESSLDRRPLLTREEQGEIGRSGLDDLTKHASTFIGHDLVRVIAETSIGSQGASGVRDTVQEARREATHLGQDPRGQERFTTPEMLALERDLRERMQGRRGEDRHPVKEKTLEWTLAARPTMKVEQEMALRHTTLGRDGIAYIKGDAGTGKTYMMEAMREVYEKEGYNVRGLSFTNKAAQGLEKDSGIKSQSVDSFLYAERQGRTKLNERTILVLDEAGMLDSRKTYELVKVAERSGAKLIAIGDEKQIQPILAGQAFGMGANEAGSVRLKEIVRQRDAWERAAVFDLAEGRTKEALQAIDDHGGLKIHEDRNEARRAMLKEWHDGTGRGLDQAPIMVASTNAEVRALNDGARAMLSADGKLQNAHTIETAHGMAEFAPGERIIFTANNKPRGIFNSTMATVERVDAKEMRVKTDTGAEITFKHDEVNRYRHAYAITAHKSQGATFDKALVMVDGYNTDREKLYVEFSRGRQGNQIYADKPTIGELTAEEVKKLREQPVADRDGVERVMYRDHLAKLVGTSHAKDTTQDYDQGRSLILERFRAGREQNAAKWKDVERQSHELAGIGLSAEPQRGPQTEKIRERHRGRGIDR